MTCRLPACTRRPRNSITQASKAVLGPFSSRLIRCTTSVTRWVYAPHTLLKSMRGSCCYPLSALQRADQYTAPVWHFIRSDWCGTAPCNTMCTAPSPVARHNSDGVDKLFTRAPVNSKSSSLGPNHSPSGQYIGSRANCNDSVAESAVCRLGVLYRPHEQPPNHAKQGSTELTRPPQPHTSLIPLHN